MFYISALTPYFGPEESFLAYIISYCALNARFHFTRPFTFTASPHTCCISIKILYKPELHREYINESME